MIWPLQLEQLPAETALLPILKRVYNRDGLCGSGDRRKSRHDSGFNPKIRRRGPASYAGFWVMRRSGGAICRHFDDLDAVLESDTSDLNYDPKCSVLYVLRSRIYRW
jgi:hypothetical protein